MSRLPKSLQEISLFLQRLPGIGEKTANRLAFFLLKINDQEIDNFVKALSSFKKNTFKCVTCCNLTEGEQICTICADERRDKNTITIVENIFDVLAFETGGIYNGVYHVLHGKIDPLNRVTPQDLTLEQLFKRIVQTPPHEVVIATNPDMEGEATAIYISQKFDEIKKQQGIDFAVTRLGYGMPLGASVEYADYGTLKKALEGRRRI